MTALVLLGGLSLCVVWQWSKVRTWLADALPVDNPLLAHAPAPAADARRLCGSPTGGTCRLRRLRIVVNCTGGDACDLDERFILSTCTCDVRVPISIDATMPDFDPELMQPNLQREHDPSRRILHPNRPPHLPEAGLL